MIIRPIDHPGLLLDTKDLDAIRAKVRTQPWASAACDHLLSRMSAITNITIDDRKGQWMHFYACPDDGTHLSTVTPTEHRCPTCGKTYTGEPYDSVVIRNRHMQNGDDALDFALAWHLSGESRYRDLAAEIVLDYADRYLSYPWHDHQGNPESGGRVFCTTLNESNWLVTMAWAYDLVAGTLSPDEKRHVCDDFLRPAARIVLTPRRNIHNIMCWRNSAAGLAALCAGDQELFDITVDSETGLHQQIAQGILPDGMWWECSWGYHFYTIHAIWPLVEAARKQGVDVYSTHYKGLFDAPIGFAFPGGVLPPINDSGAGSTLPGRCEPFEIAYARWHDPAHAGVLSTMDRTGRLSLCYGEDLPRTAAAPARPPATVNFPSAGFAILRDRATDTVVTLDYGPHGGGHGHPDKLGLILFTRGRIVAPDPGSIQYAVPLHREWFKQTLSHNTLLVDGVSQEPCQGTLVRFEPDGDVQIASATAHDAYPGVHYGRTLALVAGGAVVDLFQARSDSERTFDWVFHGRGALDASLALAPAGPLGTGHGYQHVENSRKADARGGWSLTWSEDGGGVVLAAAGHEGTEVITGLGRGNPPSEKLPMVIARRRGTSALFAAALVPFAGKAPNVSLLIERQSADSLTVRLSGAGAGKTVTLPLPLA